MSIGVIIVLILLSGSAGFGLGLWLNDREWRRIIAYLDPAVRRRIERLKRGDPWR